MVSSSFTEKHVYYKRNSVNVCKMCDFLTIIIWVYWKCVYAGAFYRYRKDTSIMPVVLTGNQFDKQCNTSIVPSWTVLLTPERKMKSSIHVPLAVFSAARIKCIWLQFLRPLFKKNQCNANIMYYYFRNNHVESTWKAFKIVQYLVVRYCVYTQQYLKTLDWAKQGFYTCPCTRKYFFKASRDDK